MWQLSAAGSATQHPGSNTHGVSEHGGASREQANDTYGAAFYIGDHLKKENDVVKCCFKCSNVNVKLLDVKEKPTVSSPLSSSCRAVWG